MAKTVTVTWADRYDDGTKVQVNPYVDVVTGPVLFKLDEPIPDSSTDLEVACAIDISAVGAVLIKSTVDMLVETNNGTTPDDSFTLVANKPVVWSIGKRWRGAVNHPKLFPSTIDVTSLFVTNASGSDGILTVRTI